MVCEHQRRKWNYAPTTFNFPTSLERGWWLLTSLYHGTDFHSHSILPGMRHNPSWVVKEGHKGLWKAPVNHLSLHCSYFHLPKPGTEQQGSVLLRKYHTLIKNGSFRLPSIISNSGFALSLLNSLISMKFKASNTLSECDVTLLQALSLILC